MESSKAALAVAYPLSAATLSTLFVSASPPAGSTSYPAAFLKPAHLRTSKVSTAQSFVLQRTNVWLYSTASITFVQQLCETNGVTIPSVVSCGWPSIPPTTSTTNVISSSSSPSNSWNGIGPLLTGTCATPDYTILSVVSTAGIWAQVVGCVNERPDCCPYSINTGGPGAFPGAALASQATLHRCPEDYASVSGGCCPSGYNLWNAALGGQTPCFITLSTSSSTLTAPPIPSSELPSVYSVSTVVSIVYAMHYPVAPRAAPLSPGAKAGIGTGSAVAGLTIGALGFLLLWQRRRHRKELESERRASDGNRASAVGGWVDNSSATMGGTRQNMGWSAATYEGSVSAPVSSWNEQNDGRQFSVPRRPLAQPHGPHPSPPELPGQQHSPTPYQQDSVSPTMLSMEGQVGVLPANTHQLQPAAARAPASSPQELHNPHWAGRYELPGVGRAQQGVGAVVYPAPMQPAAPSQFQCR
jgi:hypothetical protein